MVCWTENVQLQGHRVKSWSELTVKQRMDISHTPNLAARSAHEL